MLDPMIVREGMQGMGSVGSTLKAAGAAIATAAKQTGAAAAAGAKQSVTESIRNAFFGTPAGSSGGAPPAKSYLPWAAGGVAALVVVYLVTQR